MKYKLGDKVNPVICPEIEMLVTVIQEPERYYCTWFVDGELKDGWFGAIELRSAKENNKIGF